MLVNIELTLAIEVYKVVIRYSICIISPEIIPVSTNSPIKKSTDERPTGLIYIDLIMRTGGNFILCEF